MVPGTLHHGSPPDFLAAATSDSNGYGSTPRCEPQTAMRGLGFASGRVRSRRPSRSGVRRPLTSRAPRSLCYRAVRGKSQGRTPAHPLARGSRLHGLAPGPGGEDCRAGLHRGPALQRSSAGFGGWRCCAFPTLLGASGLRRHGSVGAGVPLSAMAGPLGAVLGGPMAQFRRYAPGMFHAEPIFRYGACW